MCGKCQRYNLIICNSTSKRQSDKGNISSGVTESGRFAFLFPALPPSIPAHRYSILTPSESH